MKRLQTIVFLLFSICCSAEQNLLDSLHERLGYRIHDTERVNILNELTWQLMYVDVDTAIDLASKALLIAKSNDWNQGMGLSYDRLGTVNLVKGDFHSALKNYQSALDLYDQLEMKKRYIGCLGNMGIVYKQWGDYPVALECFFKSLSMNEEIGYMQGAASNLNNIGLIYWQQSEYNKAIENYSKALKINEQRGHKTGMANQYGNLGLVYENVGDYESALKFHFKSIVINKELGRKNRVASELSNVGLVYVKRREYEKALEHYSTAIQMQEEVGDRDEIARIMGVLGDTYTSMGEFEKAELNLLDAIEISKTIRAKFHLKNQYRFLTHLYDTTDRPALAFQAYKQQIIYGDSLLNEENTKAQTRSEMKYEYEKAELVKKQEEKEVARLLAQKISRRDNLQYSVILLGLLVLGSLVLALGRLSIPLQVAEGLIFFSFLILFEFILVLADPYVETWTGGAPGLKLLINAGIAAMIFPLHALFESKLKKRLVSG